MKLKVISFYSRLLSFLLVLLGFSSCSEIDPKDEYGVPSAKFKVKGALVDKTDNSTSITGIKVAIGQLDRNETGLKTYYVDSVVTNNTGEFNLSVTDFPVSQKFVIKYEDTNAVQSGNYGLITDTVRFENPSFTDGDGSWYKGETVKDLGKVKISKKEN
ncbi:MAG: radical SAM-associated putative lipoprotein [Dysgonomonas sp.]